MLMELWEAEDSHLQLRNQAELWAQELSPTEIWVAVVLPMEIWELAVLPMELWEAVAEHAPRIVQSTTNRITVIQ